MFHCHVNFIVATGNAIDICSIHGLRGSVSCFLCHTCFIFISTILLPHAMQFTYVGSMGWEVRCLVSCVTLSWHWQSLESSNLLHWMLTWEFAVTALSEGFSAQVILTWSLQVTALSKGWHRACRFRIFCWMLTRSLIQGLAQDKWGWQGLQWRLVSWVYHCSWSLLFKEWS